MRNLTLASMKIPPGPAAGLLRAGAASGRLVHAEVRPRRRGRTDAWPQWIPDEVIGALRRQGVSRPWTHQADTANLVRSGQSVIIATGAASGKSLAYLLPALTEVMDGHTVLYLSPTRALAADQLRVVSSLGLSGVRAAVIDGDTTAAERGWARAHANYLLTTPDMLHHALLPQHARWEGFFRRLRIVVIDECHGYRGVFGSHVAHVLRRLTRVAATHAYREPLFVLATATISDPARSAALLCGTTVTAVTSDAAPGQALTVALWEPAPAGTKGGSIRRSANSEAGQVLTELVAAGVPAVAFVRSRTGAETVALEVRRTLIERGAPALAERVAAYRSGYLAEERRAIENALRTGQITGLAATTALEAGVDLPQLDAVVIAGWPGTRARFWQEAGRAGRKDRAATVILIARDDPLDAYLVHHPAAVFAEPVEATVLDPDNPYVIRPHLCAAAAEFALTEADLDRFAPSARQVAHRLVLDGLLRARAGGWHCTRAGLALRTELRGAGGQPVRVVERGTGRLIGTVDEPSAHLLTHPGAAYPHRGEVYLIAALDLADRVALAEPRDPGYMTIARERTRISVKSCQHQMAWGDTRVHYGEVLVTRKVVGYTRRDVDTGRSLGRQVLRLPARQMPTKAVWWTISPAQRTRLVTAAFDPGGAAHAAEHASIGLLPLVAACDRWDVGGVSADPHPDTGALTVFVYDGHFGGAGFAERGYDVAREWLRATAQAIADCACPSGCPSCVHSPKCGNGNNPLDKDGAVRLLEIALSESIVGPRGRADTTA